MTNRGGMLLARAFNEKGVRQVFTLSGGFCNPALEGFMECQIPVINSPHEQVAGHLAEGRVPVTFDLHDSSDSHELVFHAKRYFEKQTLPDDGFQITDTVVARLSVPAPGATVHIPLVLLPHSSTFWCSGDPPQ